MLSARLARCMLDKTSPAQKKRKTKQHEIQKDKKKTKTKKPNARAYQKQFKSLREETVCDGLEGPAVRR
jgi:hypothetical protein